ncbi:MAG: sigma-54-dependent Fis family transcriptional regulator, partial [Myxococcales bacterium]|nr:sigma-54-dependent Fis family transcriptional regulator [Myxococcales bacterium]
DRARPGLFEAADKGTIFLDEIGEMSPAAQVRLLRVLDQRTVTRIGSTKEIPIDVRLVSATHRDLQALIRSGKFRQDLFFRISTTTIQIPPLRARPLEVPLLARHFADAIATRMALEPPWLDDAALERLRAHTWPGNVRELKNAMEHAVVMASGGRIGVEHLPEGLRGPSDPPRSEVRDRVASAERQAIIDALKQTGENRTHAAKLLGISRRTLVYKLARYGI